MKTRHIFYEMASSLYTFKRHSRLYTKHVTKRQHKPHPWYIWVLRPITNFILLFQINTDLQSCWSAS